MNRIRSVLLVLCLALFLGGIFTVSAQSSSASLTDASAYMTSEDACVQFSLHVSGENGRDVRVGAFAQYYANDKGILNIGTTDENATPSGNYITSQTVVTPSYDNSRFDDMELCVPLRYFPIAENDYDFYFYVEVTEDASGDVINSFNFKPLTYSGLGSSGGMRMQNVIVDAQTEGIVVTFSLYTYGYKGATLHANLYPKYAVNGQQLDTNSGEYTTNNGYLVGSTDLNAKYDISYWSQGKDGNPVTIFIPYTAFPTPTKSAGYDVAFDLQVFYKNDAVVTLDLSDSEYVVNIHPARAGSGSGST